MALPIDGPISMDMIRNELGRTGPISLLDTDVLKLAGKSGPPVSFLDFRGKSREVRVTYYTPGWSPRGDTTFEYYKDTAGTPPDLPNLYSCQALNNSGSTVIYIAFQSGTTIPNVPYSVNIRGSVGGNFGTFSGYVTNGNWIQIDQGGLDLFSAFGREVWNYDANIYIEIAYTP